MLRTSRLALPVVLTALLVVVTSVPLQAIGPAIVMLYGGDLREPVLVAPGNPSVNSTEFLWSPTNGGVQWGSRTRGTLPSNLEGRRFVNVAFFWGWHDAATLKPSDASQHGRFYPATASAPAVIVITAPHMAHTTDNSANPEPRPIPTSLDGFYAGWTTTVDVVSWARQQAESAMKAAASFRLAIDAPLGETRVECLRGCEFDLAKEQRRATSSRFEMSCSAEAGAARCSGIVDGFVDPTATVPSRADFELKVTSPGGATTVTCVRGCGLQFIRYAPEKTAAQSSFSYTCGAPGMSCGSSMHAWVLP
jgi:hypothetical protein